MPATLTPQIIWAAATDAANNRARGDGRTAWSLDDYEYAIFTYNRLANCAGLPHADQTEEGTGS